MNTKKIIDEYSASYCYALELAYGPGMMSEGGAKGIEHMFADIDIANKNLLDIGFGLGGAAMYLAEKYNANVQGVELNPWMVAEANRRVPSNLKNKVKFYQYEDKLSFADAEFDIIYSKGVLCHLEYKPPLFAEINRTLKTSGQLIINDWLSPIKNKWSGRMQEICDLEDLTLFAETEAGYHAILLNAGFENIKFRNENAIYAAYNRQIANCLEQENNGKKFATKYNESELQDAIKGYRLIATAMENEELLVYRITANHLPQTK
jgi:cyclopropane fatty-acyl-phospholipid synthase-like methyltransferase